jgi:hypothetical protein
VEVKEIMEGSFLLRVTKPAAMPPRVVYLKREVSGEPYITLWISYRHIFKLHESDL